MRVSCYSLQILARTPVLVSHILNFSKIPILPLAIIGMAFLHALIIVASLIMSVFSASPIVAQISARANKVPEKLHCFKACYGVNRTIVEQTIHNFCASYDGVYLNKDGPAGTFRGIFADQ